MAELRPAIIRGRVTHARAQPVANRFAYALVPCGLELLAIAALAFIPADPEDRRAIS